MLGKKKCFLLICQENLFLKSSSKVFPLNCVSLSDVIWKTKKISDKLDTSVKMNMFCVPLLHLLCFAQVGVGIYCIKRRFQLQISKIRFKKISSESNTLVLCSSAMWFYFWMSRPNLSGLLKEPGVYANHHLHMQ